MPKPVEISLRLAEPSDCGLLARAAVAAGGGIYEHLLENAAKGFAPEAAIAAALAQDNDGFGWRSGIVAEDAAGGALGAAIAYPARAYRLAPAIAAAAGAAAKRDLAPLFDSIPPEDSYYLHAIWAAPEARGKGVGGLLLDSVIAFGVDQEFARTSLHVWRDNVPALALYRSRGFETLDRLDVPRRPLLPHDGGKLLMATT